MVGVTTLNIGDRDIEVWYPVDPGTEAGAEKASYASFTVLPEAIQRILPPDLNIVVPMDAYRDLPVSGAGPFPILTFSHGAGGFRQAYSGLLTGIASHGFVVASLDHLEWGLLAQVGLLPPGVDRDAGEVVLAAVERLAAANADPSSPLAGGVDATRIATAGHSAGGRAAFALPDRPEVKAMLGFATGASSSGVAGKPILLLAGAEDAGARGLEQAYDDLSPIKRFVAIDRAAHNSFTDQCAIIWGGNNFLIKLVEAGFPIPQNLLGARHRRLSPGESGPGRVLEGDAALHGGAPARRVRIGRSAGRSRRRRRRRLRRRDAALSPGRRPQRRARRRARLRLLRRSPRFRRPSTAIRVRAGSI